MSALERLKSAENTKIIKGVFSTRNATQAVVAHSDLALALAAIEAIIAFRKDYGVKISAHDDLYEALAALTKS